MQKSGFWPQNYAGAAAKKLPRPSLFPAPGGMGHKTMLAPLRKSSPDPHFLLAPGAQDCTKKEGLATKLCWRRYEKSSPDPHFFPLPGAQDRIFSATLPAWPAGRHLPLPRGFNTKTEARARLNAVCAHLRIAPYSPGTSEKYGFLGGWCSRPRQREIHCTG